jgi:hypothetical protein
MKKIIPVLTLLLLYVLQPALGQIYYKKQVGAMSVPPISTLPATTTIRVAYKQTGGVSIQATPVLTVNTAIAATETTNNKIQLRPLPYFALCSKNQYYF